MSRTVYCLNVGSSSLKFSVFEQCDRQLIRRMRGAAERLGTDQRCMWYEGGNEHNRRTISIDLADHRGAAVELAELLTKTGQHPPDALGHRIVHGGPRYSKPTPIDSSVLNELRRLGRFAPMHQPHAISVLEAMAERFPRVPQIACFDTAIHRGMPDIAQRYPLPSWLWDEGVRRYGFHGLSYEFLLRECSELREGKAVIAHLGHGASLTAFQDGVPQYTTMGFTPTGGLVMATRSGDLDPGVLLYLMEHHRYGWREIDRLVNSEAGLLGLSAISSDMKTLESRASDKPRDLGAGLAIESFCRSVGQHIGAAAAVLGGISQLAFTGGIGEHSAHVRAEICRPLGFLGIDLDKRRNQTHARIISCAGSSCTAYVLPTDEELMIARHTLQALSDSLL